jgi:adenine C2-methylase RlmN of 23S rRNA A2503 and tRNA A37
MLSDIVRNHEVTTITKDLVMQFGNPKDGAIEFAGVTKDGIIETGYFYGDDKPKNIVVISSQIGCPGRCSFCELGDEKFIRSLTPNELYDQVILMLQQADQYSIDIDSIKHKVSLAKSGEPLFNKKIVEGLEKIAKLSVSFKVSTVFPRGVIKNFQRVADFASSYTKPIQLQISLISTSEEYREKASGIRPASFREIQKAADYWKSKNPEGRKINMSLILTADVPCDANDIYNLFPPDLFRFRFRNYVPTEKGANNSLDTITKSGFEQIKANFKEKGYDVGEWATPTPIEQRFCLASNVTRRRYLKMVKGEI